MQKVSLIVDNLNLTALYNIKMSDWRAYDIKRSLEREYLDVYLARYDADRGLCMPTEDWNWDDENALVPLPHENSERHEKIQRLLRSIIKYTDTRFAAVIVRFLRSHSASLVKIRPLNFRTRCEIIHKGRDLTALQST